MKREKIPSPVLTALAGVYGGVVLLRNALYDAELLPQTRSPLPVISIGNITAGGSGKTPVAAYVARLLRARGFEPVVLTRGYRGELHGPHRVTAANTPREVGDEALLHRTLSGVPVVVSRDRAAGARFIHHHHLGNVVILDDGFQHRRLKRTVDLVLIDTSRPLCALLPRGDLRESPARALRRASAVLLIDRGGERTPLPPLPPLPPGMPTFSCSLLPRTVYDGWSGEPLDASLYTCGRPAAVTAIAHAEQFFQTLRALGVPEGARTPFPDHHLFTEEEWRTLRGEAQGPLLCTEKDLVKLRQFVAGPGELFVVSQEVILGDEERFAEFLLRHLDSPDSAPTSHTPPAQPR